MHPRRLPARLLPLAALLAVTTACSSTEDTGAQPPAPMPTASAPASASAQTAPPAAASQPSAAAPAQAATVTINDFKYDVPGPVPAGAQLVIPNKDSEAHTFTLRGTDAKVVVQGNGTATLTAPAKPGTYEVVCDFHGGMTAKLVVS